MRTPPGPQFIRLSKYNCTASPRSSTPFINSNLLVSGTTPHSSYHCADPMGLLLQDKRIDPPVQDLWVSGTYKLQLFWFGCHFFYLCETPHLLWFLREAVISPPSLLSPDCAKIIEGRRGGRMQTRTKCNLTLHMWYVCFMVQECCRWGILKKVLLFIFFMVK